MQDNPLTTDCLVDCAKLFLKTHYRRQIKTYRARLENFDRVNWDLLQETLQTNLSEHPPLYKASDKTTASLLPMNPNEAAAQLILDWLENTLMD